MQFVCGIAALVILIAGICMFGRSLKNGAVFDCIEGSKTEGRWITREANPGKFWVTLSFYIVVFSMFTIYLAQVCLTGE